MLAALAGHGISNPDAAWWIMQLRSPNLSSSSTWQTATGYSVQIGEQLAVMDRVYANLYVKVYDNVQARDRWFYSGTAQALTHNAWNALSFDWSGISTFPSNYVLREVFINIWGKMSDPVEGAVYLDEVRPLAASAPTMTATATPTRTRIATGTASATITRTATVTTTRTLTATSTHTATPAATFTATRSTPTATSTPRLLWLPLLLRG